MIFSIILNSAYKIPNRTVLIDIIIDTYDYTKYR